MEKRTQLVRLEGLGIWVEAVESWLVDERVLPLGAPTSIEDSVLGGAHHRLNFVRVDNSGNIGVRNLGSREAVVIKIIRIHGYRSA